MYKNIHLNSSFLLVVCFLLWSCGTTQQLSDNDDILHFQKELDKEYKDSSTSPLYPIDRKNFTGHQYFPIKEKYIVRAALNKIHRAETVRIPTSSGGEKRFTPKYIASFSIDQKPYQLTIYVSESLSDSPEYKDYLFLPFRDLTNGEDSYGGGRYLDLKEMGRDFIIIDFNKAYNPYCAYSEEYNCPIVPIENSLDIRVEAGVRLPGGLFEYHKKSLNYPSVPITE